MLRFLTFLLILHSFAVGASDITKSAHEFEVEKYDFEREMEDYDRLHLGEMKLLADFMRQAVKSKELSDKLLEEITPIWMELQYIHTDYNFLYEEFKDADLTIERYYQKEGAYLKPVDLVRAEAVLEFRAYKHSLRDLRQRFDLIKKSFLKRIPSALKLKYKLETL